MIHKLKDIFIKKGVKGVCFDSRLVRPGDAFFAIKGERFDGNNYIEIAFAKGALVVFTDNPGRRDINIEYVEDIRLALALAAGIIFPKLPNNIVAVTGTNGKSSVVSYVNQILTILGKSSACFGTLGIKSSTKIGDNVLSNDNNGLTTTDHINFRKILDILADSGINYVAFEASSHGLLQKRLGNVRVDSAAFVSFSQDHLEYHKTMEDYIQAKLILFRDNLKQGGIAVINSDMMFFDLVKTFLIDHNIEFCTVGKNGDIKIQNIKSSLNGQLIKLQYKNQNYQFKTDIIGSFQALNMLIAAKLVHNVIDVEFSKIINILPNIQPVSGRLQRVTDMDSEYQVFVDYAHTPDALEKSLEELSRIKIKGGKLYVVFGCGGDRDKSKREIMGKVAGNIADIVVVTDDNPRTEDPAAIRAQIIAKNTNFLEMPDRKQAIINTILKLKEDDILLIAGKGHENYQIIGTKKIFFSDIDIAISQIG